MPLFEKGYQAPSIHERSFNCPHCNALAKQFWFSTRAVQLDKDRTPIFFTEETAAAVGGSVDDKVQALQLRNWAKRIASQKPIMEEKTSDPYSHPLQNLSISKCYNCDDISVWIGARLASPLSGNVAAPNNDMPADAKRDYQEAAEIVEASPRGAAALLRLAIQKMCVALGQPGKNINNDISALVRLGLDPRIQQALDIVRVIGNNAVHPGELDIRDDQPTAERLFQLLNLITDMTISQPKHVDEMYAALPEGARVAIEHRDK